MFQHLHNQTTHLFGIGRSLHLPRPIVSSIIITALLASLSHFYQPDHSGSEVAKLHSDVLEIRKQMANKDDVAEIRSSLLQLEKDVERMSDNLPHRR